MSRKLKKIGVSLLVTLFWLMVWQLLSMAVHQQLLLPSPLDVAEVLIRLIGTGGFWQAVGLSLLRVLAGFAFALLGGVLFAALTRSSRLFDRVFSPILRLVRTVPVASFIILALVWIQTEWLPVFVVFLMVVPIVWENLRAGLDQIDPRLLEMARVYQLSRRQVWKVILLPSVLPYFLSAFTTGLGFAWKSAVAAEVICKPVLSIGRRLQDAKVYLETPELFAWTVTIVVLSLTLEKLLVCLIRKIQKQPTSQEVPHADSI